MIELGGSGWMGGVWCVGVVCGVRDVAVKCGMPCHVMSCQSSQRVSCHAISIHATGSGAREGGECWMESLLFSQAPATLGWKSGGVVRCSVMSGHTPWRMFVPWHVSCGMVQIKSGSPSRVGP